MENPNQQNQAEDDILNKAANQLFRGEGLDFSHLASRDASIESDSVSEAEMSNDDIYDFIQQNRDRSFDKTTAEGRLLYLRYKEAAHRRNQFTFDTIKQMGNIVAQVPSDIVSGVARNIGIGKDSSFTPQRIAGSVVDGVLRDVRDLAGLLTQSEDPSSPLFRFRNLITGSGSIEDQIDQFNEARWWGNRSNELEEGKADIISEWVPDDYKEFAKKLVDPKLANALSYIGLDTIPFIKARFARQGLKDSVRAYKGLDDFYKVSAEEALQTRDWFETSAAKFAKLSQKITGETLVAGSKVIDTPISYIQEKIARGSDAIGARVGYVPPEIANGASTLLTDVAGTVTKEGVEIGPMRSVLFSFGLKPIAEYAGVLGNEMIDAYQGVVKPKSEHLGAGMLQRLALNGGRISMSKEAQAVAKFTNVVVGWPASMAFPALKRAVGDAAYMGLLGYANARGEGAAGGVGVGFAWGGMSGALRHLHNVHTQAVAHDYIIKNFDDYQIQSIAKASPKHADNVSAFLKHVDSFGNKRVSATVRAQVMMGWNVNAQAELRFTDLEGLAKEYGIGMLETEGLLEEGAATAKGAHLRTPKGDVIWVNKGYATPEATVHEYGHLFLDRILSKTDGSAVDALKSFIGLSKDSGIAPDKVLALWIANYSQRRFKMDVEGGNRTGAGKGWLFGPASPVYASDGTSVEDFGNYEYALQKINLLRERMAKDPDGMFGMYQNDKGAMRLRAFDEFPIIERLMHETFAYNQSNSLLTKAPDIFLRNKDLGIIRGAMENWFTLRNQRVVNDMETAGILVKEKLRQSEEVDVNGERGGPVLENMFWEDGTYLSFPLLDRWVGEQMKRVLKYGDVNVTTLTGDRADAWAKQTGKTRFFGGGKIKTKKEIEAIITETSNEIASTLDSLPDEVKPKWEVTKGGNRRVSLTNLSQEAWQAIKDSGTYTKEEYNALVTMVEVLKQIDAGKPVFNTYHGQYLGSSQQVVEAALGERLKGRQVAVTSRHFAPFNIELVVSNFDEMGNPLRTPRSHITIHAHDVSVLSKRKLNQWNKPEVRALFRDFGHFSETFVHWFENHSRDASTRKTSADLLRPEFGDRAEKVRDIMYETWGGRKRNDESYINAPEGYAGGKDGPLYPIHSLRFDLLANIQRQSQIFPEAFSGQVMGLFYKEGVGYEPMRRNMMLGNFTERELANGRRFYTNGNGYEIRGEMPKFKVFNPYGNLIGVFKTIGKAQAAADNHASKMNPAELSPTREDLGESPIVENYDNPTITPAQVYSGMANLCVHSGGYLPFSLSKSAKGNSGSNLVEFARKLKEHNYKVSNNLASATPVPREMLYRRFDEIPSVPLHTLIDNPEQWRNALGAEYFDRIKIAYDPRAEFHGGVVFGVSAGRVGDTMFGVSPEAFDTDGSMLSASNVIRFHLQGLISFREKTQTMVRTGLSSMDSDFMTMYGAGQTIGFMHAEYAAQNPNGPFTQKAFDDWRESSVTKEIQEKAIEMAVDPRYVSKNLPAFVKGTFSKDHSGVLIPRYASALFNTLGTKTAKQGVPSIQVSAPKVAESLNNWMCDIVEEYISGRANAFILGNNFVVTIDPVKWNLPTDVRNYFDKFSSPDDPSGGIYWQGLKSHLQKSFLSHAFSKTGSRNVKKGIGIAGNADFYAENIRISKMNEGSYATAQDNFGSFIPVDIEFDAKYPSVSTQMANMVGGTQSGRALVMMAQVTGAGAVISGPFSKFVITTPNLTVMTYSDFDKSGKFKPKTPTTDPTVGLGDVPYFENNGRSGLVEAPVDLEAQIQGVLPFSGITGKGSLFKHFNEKWHIDHVEKLARDLGIAFDRQKDGTAEGLMRWQKGIFLNGTQNASLLYLHRVAVGAMQAEIGASIMRDPNDPYFGKLAAISEVDAAVVNKAEFGEAIANKGYANIIHAAQNASLDSIGSRYRSRKGKRTMTIGSSSSIIEGSFKTSDKPSKSEALTKSFVRSVKETMRVLDEAGYDPHRREIKGMERKSNFMLGGFHSSTAKEREMLETGAMRLVKTDGGKTYKAFEFSDKDAALLLEKVGGKMHLLPFMEDGEAGLNSYIRNTELGLDAAFLDANSVKLGDILDHKLLYLHYPALKDVQVLWKEGYGADYNPESDVIRLGIDGFIGEELANRRNPDYKTHALFGHDGQRQVTEIILHEIQHAIQMREMWSDTAAVHTGRFEKVGQIMAANIAGIAGRTIAESGRGKASNEGGILFFTDDGTRAPSDFSDAETLKSIYRLGNTPMHKHLRQIAYPAFMRVSNEAINALTDAHIHHPPEHPARRNAQVAVKSLVAMRQEARRLAEQFKSGEISEEYFKAMMCDPEQGLAPKFIARLTQVRNSMYLDSSPIAEKLYNALDNADKYLHRSIEALNGFELIAKMAERDGVNGDVATASAKLRQTFSQLANMHYLSQRIEIEANLTERRSMMTQAELNSTGLNPDGTRKSLLDGITGAMDIGYKGNTLKNIGLAIRNNERIRVADFMIGGVASKDPSRSTTSRDILSMMARGSLITWTIRTLNNELDALDRVAVIGRGWEVAEDGSVKLTAKTATVQLNSKNRKTMKEYGKKFSESIPSQSTEIFMLDSEDRLHVTNAIWGSGERTVTIEDVARIVDGIVLNEWEIRTPTEVMDTVLRDDFPAVIKISELEETLVRLGVSQDGLHLANLPAFYKEGDGKSSSYGPLTVTKYELADILAVFHRQYINERIASTAQGSGKFSEVQINKETSTPSRVIEAIESVYSNPNDKTNDPLGVFYGNEMGSGFEPFDVDSRRMYRSDNPNATRVGISNLDLDDRLAIYNVNMAVPKPDWIRQEDYDYIVDRLTKRGLLRQGRFFNEVTSRGGYKSMHVNQRANDLARDLNRRIRRKFFLIERFYKKAVSVIENSRSLDVKKVKIKLLDDLSRLLIEPELEGMRDSDSLSGTNSQQVSLKIQSGRDAVNVYPDFTKSPSARFGMTNALSASGNIFSGDSGFIELQTIQTAVGFTTPMGRGDNTHIRGVGTREGNAGLQETLYTPESWTDANLKKIAWESRPDSERFVSSMFEHLQHIANVTTHLNNVVSEVINANESGDVDANPTDTILKLRLLNDISKRLYEQENRTTALIGEGKESNSESASRNVIVGQGYVEGAAPRIAQESFLLKGYSGRDGSVVIGETKIANTVAATQLQGYLSVPFFDGSGAPSVVSNPSVSVPAASALVARDMAIRTVLFSSIQDADLAGQTQGPLSYIVPISDFMRAFRVPTTFSVDLGKHNSPDHAAAVGMVGVHALHSCLYTACARAGVEVEGLTSALSGNKNFYEVWGNRYPDLRDGVTGQMEISAATYVPAMAPLIAAALGGKQVGVRRGSLTVVDHLLPAQRELLKAARDAYRDFSMDEGREPTESQKAASDAFFESIGEDQHKLLFGHMHTANAEITMVALAGAYEALSMIPKLPEAPLLDALFGGSIKDILSAEIGNYISEGRYMYEKGTGNGTFASKRWDSGNTGGVWMSEMYKSIMKSSQNRHLLMATWALMDQHASGYRPVVSQISSPSEQAYPKYYRNGYKQTLLEENGPVPVGRINTRYTKRPFMSLGSNSVSSEYTAVTTTVPEAQHSMERGQAFKSGDELGEFYVLKPLDVGLAESLFEPIDPSMTSLKFKQFVDGAVVEQPDTIAGVPKIEVAMRGSPLSGKLTRQQIVNSIITQAKRAKTDSISLEPARMRLSGRRVSNAYQRAAEGGNINTGDSLGFRAHTYGIGNNLFGPFTINTKFETGVTGMQTMSPARVGLTEPMRGFAWKRLEDGSLVINISGDITGYKAGYLGNQMRFLGEEPKKMNVGFSIRESLGYDPRSGEISPSSPYASLFGGHTIQLGAFGAAGLQNFFRIGGDAWRKQIIASARNRLKFGDAIRTQYEGVEQNRESIRNLNARGMNVLGLHDAIMNDENAYNNKDAILLAMAINAHKTGAQHISLTFSPEQVNPDFIKGVLAAVMIQGAGVDIMTRNFTSAMEYGGHQISPYLGDGERIIELLKTTHNTGVISGPKTRIDQLMGPRLPHLQKVGGDLSEIREILESQGNVTGGDSGREPDRAREKFIHSATQVLSRSENIMGDIERIAASATKGDHGYILPDAERHLAKNGDVMVAIQHMFPNRPELAQFAWDGKESNGVSIVHRGPKSKPTGYFVTYDIQTGVDANGDPIMSRKVVPTKTLVEAEAIRNKFGASASKAIMAQALVSAGAGNAFVKEGVMHDNDNIENSVRQNKHLDVSERTEGALSMVNEGTFTVGDLDLNLSKAEATALSAALGSRSVLQTKLPPVEVKKANLMIGDKNARELESMTRRKLNFGFGQGPVEFVSKMMRVIAYGRKKSGRDKYPDSMTGLEWYKFFKENSVSKDEIRMTGVAFLLHDNAETHLTRKDLAEFVYTVYPRTSRQARTPTPNVGQDVAKTKAGSLSGIYNMPYLEDLQTKENFVMKTHLNNLQSVAELIEDRLKDESTKADAEALKASIMKSLEFTINEMGAPEGMRGLDDLRTAVNFLRNEYEMSTNETAYTKQGWAGESRVVRPAILEYVMHDTLFGRTSDQYKTIETALGDLGLINPYEILSSDTSGEYSPFGALSLSDGARGKDAWSLSHDVGPLGKGPEKSTYLAPSFQSQNFYYHGGNYHASWASFTGYYQSNPIFTEVANARLTKEKDKAIEVIKARIMASSNDAEKAKYESIITNINRVFAVRTAITKGNSISDYGHYSDNDTGTFQIGHVRTTQSVLKGEYGIGDPKTPAYHTEDGVYGFDYSPEVVISIEEIQSDSFQYHTFGPPSTPEKALPDSIEQVEGFKRVGDLNKLKESREQIKGLVQNSESIIMDNVFKQSFYGMGDAELNATFAVRLIQGLSPVERFILSSDLGLVDSGRTVEVPEGLRPYVGGRTRIAVFEFPEFTKYKDLAWRNERADTFDSNTAANTLNTLMDAAIDSVINELMPDRISASEVKDIFKSNSGNTAHTSRRATPSLLLSLIAATDDEVAAKSIEIDKASKDNLPYEGIDWDAVALRALNKVKGARESIINSDSDGRISKYAKIKFFDALVASYEEWLSSPSNRSSAALASHGGYMTWDNRGLTEYNELQKHIVSNRDKFRLVGSQNFRMGVGSRVFPDYTYVKRDFDIHGSPLTSMSGTRKFDAFSPQPEGTDSFEVQYRVGSTALGTMVANGVQPLVSLISASGDAPQRLLEVEKAITELQKLVPVSTNERDPNIVNSIPFGVEDVYKPISLNGTVMRAANAGLSAITYADARHQVNRGHSMDASSALLVGRQAHVMYLGQDNQKAYMLSYLNMLPDWLAFQLHDGFMKRMAQFSPAEFIAYFRNKERFEHGGVMGTYSAHLHIVLREAIPHIFTEGLSIDDVPNSSGLRDVWKALSEDRISDMESAVSFGDNAFTGDSSVLAPDGKPYKPRDLQTPFLQKYYGKQVIGEKKSGNQRTIDNAINNVGRYQFWFERGDAMGYVSQYGAPSWFMESIMWGQHKRNQDAFSTDAFIRPNAVLRDDGTWAVINSKTGAVIMEKIKDTRMLREVMLQNSEYTGRLPYIGQFIKQWGPVGGYVTQGHQSGYVTGSDVAEWSGQFGLNLERTKKRNNVILSPEDDHKRMAPSIIGTGSASGSMFANAPTKPMSPTGSIVQELGYKIWMKHVMKTDTNDATAVSNALTTLSSSGGPVLRFKPRFPNEAHKAAFRKKIVEGIALLMPSGGGLQKPKADTATLEALSRMYENFSKVTKGRRIPTKGEALEDEDEYSR